MADKKKKKAYVPTLPPTPKVDGNPIDLLFDTLSSELPIRFSNFSDCLERAALLKAAIDGTKIELENVKGDTERIDSAIERAEKYIAKVGECSEHYYIYKWAQETVETIPFLPGVARMRAAAEYLRIYEENKKELSAFDSDSRLAEIMKLIREGYKKREWEDGRRTKVLSLILVPLLLLSLAAAVVGFIGFADGSNIFFYTVLSAHIALGAAAAALCAHISVKSAAFAKPILYVISALGIGALLSARLYATAVSLWYIPIFAAVILLSLVYAWDKDLDGPVMIISISSMLVLLALFGFMIVVKCSLFLRASDFFDATFFGAIGNFFMGAWDILSGMFVAMAQFFMLAVGAGYWLPQFYEGMILSAALLNTIGYYTVVSIGALMLSSFIYERRH